jgi:hypothetical protein
MFMPELPEIGDWRNGTTVLIGAVATYLAGKDMSAMELAAVRGYLRDWMQGNREQGREIAILRRSIAYLRTPEAITKWLARAKRSGLDPLQGALCC